MDLLFTGRRERLPREMARLRLELRKTTDSEGKPLSSDQLKANTMELEQVDRVEREAADYQYQPPTLTFDSALDLDLGGRVVQIRHLGRGNTAGDAVAFVPDAKVLASGDLLVHPIPFMFDGYPTEWVQTLDKLAGIDAAAIVPGHGGVLRDKDFIYLVRDFLQAAIRQLNERLKEIGPAEFAEFSQVKDGFDLTGFRPKFVAAFPQFDEDYTELERRVATLVFREAQLR